MDRVDKFNFPTRHQRPLLANYWSLRAATNCLLNTRKITFSIQQLQALGCVCFVQHS